MQMQIEGGIMSESKKRSRTTIAIGVCIVIILWFSWRKRLATVSSNKLKFSSQPVADTE